MNQTNWEFIKYVIPNTNSITPEQLKKKSFKQIIKTEHEKLDTEEGESIKDDMEFTTSTDMSQEDSISDTSVDDTEKWISTETHQVHNVCNKSTHHENDSNEDEHMTEIELPTKSGEQDIGKESKLLSINFEVKI